LLKDKGVQKAVEYHSQKVPLWTRAIYGGTAVSQTAVNTVLADPTRDPLRAAGARRNHYYGRLFYFDQGLCSWVGRDEDFSVCRGRYSESGGILVTPGIIQRWVQPDPVTFIFSVRKGVLWPNIPPVTRTDRELTADDVKWFLDTTKREGVLRGSFVDVKEFAVQDRYTLKVTLERPLPDFMRSMVQSGLGVFAKECCDEGDPCMSRKIITPSPWLLKDYVPRTRAVFEKNPEFYLKGLPYVDQWVWLYIADPGAQQAAFITRQALNFRGTTEQQSLPIAKQTPGSRLTLSYSAASGTMLIPKLEGPLADVRVRRALMMAMDLRTVWEVSTGGVGVVPTYFGRDLLGVGKSFFLGLDLAGEWYQYDPQRAKKLLADAGFPSGFQTTITSQTASDALLAVQSQWKKNLSVDVQIKVVDAVTATTLLLERKWQGMITGYAAPFWTDGDTGFIPFAKGGAFNYQNVNDSLFDDLWAKARLELDPAKRAGLIWQAEQRELDQVYMFRINHAWPWDIFSGTELNGATHVWDFYYSLGVAWMTMLDPNQPLKR
jgi:peptide/nickel transport system substrate-binding protein